MEPRQPSTPVNRNPRAMQDIKMVLNPTAAPVNPFTGQVHQADAANRPAVPPSAASEFAPKPSAPPAQAHPTTPAPPPPQQPPSPADKHADFKPEVVASIPVAQPGANASPMVPVPSPTRNAGNDDDLDKILEAVNNRVKAPAKPTDPKAKPVAAIAQKVKAGSGKVKSKVGASRPVGAIVATVLVAVMLALTAVFAYHQGASTKVGASTAKVGTTSQASSSIQEAGNLLIKPSDLDDYSQSLQQKIDNLNDSQDFNQQPVSDKMLGL